MAFERALKLGADGLETDIGLTADGVPVLVHAGFSLRSRSPIARLRRSELPSHIPSLLDLYDRCGTDFHLSLDMAAPGAADAVIATAAERGAVDKLWLTYWRLPTLEAWRRRWADVRLVYPTLALHRGRFASVLERLSAAGVDAINVWHPFCTSRMVNAAHLHNLRMFAWGVGDRKRLQIILARGVDGVYCDDAEALGDLLGAPR